MKKEYTLTIKISVDVNDKVKDKDKESGNPKLVGYIQQLLSTISKNEDALRGYCTHYFTDLLLNGNCYDELFDLWGTKDMPEILDMLDLNKELTPDAADFIKTIFSPDDDTHIKDDVSVQYRDLFTDQFSEPIVTVA